MEASLVPATCRSVKANGQPCHRYAVQDPSSRPSKTVTSRSSNRSSWATPYPAIHYAIQKANSPKTGALC